jgi:energy-coupling factor transporter transmembrane protein EcfT
MKWQKWFVWGLLGYIMCFAIVMVLINALTGNNFNQSAYTSMFASIFGMVAPSPDDLKQWAQSQITKRFASSRALGASDPPPPKNHLSLPTALIFLVAITFCFIMILIYTLKTKTPENGNALFFIGLIYYTISAFRVKNEPEKVSQSTQNPPSMPTLNTERTLSPNFRYMTESSSQDEDYTYY